MMRKLTLMLALLGTSLAAFAGPMEDRQALIAHYRQALPDIKFENYIYGSLSMSADAKSQYDEFMSFPSYSMDLEKGQHAWEKPFENGKKFSSCFPNGGKNVAGNYPYFDTAAGRVVTFENAINACLVANGEKELPYGGTEMGLLTAYAKSLSDGMKVDVKVEGKSALAAYEKGKEYYYARRGKLNDSCASCHVDNVGKLMNGDHLSMMIGQAAHYPVFLAGTDITTLQQRFMQCTRNMGDKPLAANSETYNDLEYFLTYMSNGLPMQTPVYRK